MWKHFVRVFVIITCCRKTKKIKPFGTLKHTCHVLRCSGKQENKPCPPIFWHVHNSINMFISMIFSLQNVFKKQLYVWIYT